jgi:hypothetical protein
MLAAAELFLVKAMSSSTPVEMEPLQLLYAYTHSMAGPTTRTLEPFTGFQPSILHAPTWLLT